MNNLPTRKPDSFPTFMVGFSLHLWDMIDHWLFILPLKDGRETILAERKTVHNMDLTPEYLERVRALILLKLLTEYVSTTQSPRENNTV